MGFICEKFEQGECDNCNKCSIEAFLEMVYSGKIEYKTKDEFVVKFLSYVYGD